MNKNLYLLFIITLAIAVNAAIPQRDLEKTVKGKGGDGSFAPCTHNNKKILSINFKWISIWGAGKKRFNIKNVMLLHVNNPDLDTLCYVILFEKDEKFFLFRFKIMEGTEVPADLLNEFLFASFRFDRNKSIWQTFWLLHFLPRPPQASLI